MDPNYLAAPGEDYHSFRALAERSQLADMVKDTSVVTQVPELGPAWEKQVDATAGWQHFKLADFHRLKNDFGVDWVIVSLSATSRAGLRVAQCLPCGLPHSLKLPVINRKASRQFCALRVSATK